MKYEVTKDEDGSVNLKLGLNHTVKFQEDATLEDVVNGVEQLIQTVVGVSAFELAMAVVTELVPEEDIPADELKQVDEPAHG